MGGDASYNRVGEATITAPLFEKIFSYRNLYRAFYDCCEGVRWKRSVQNYSLNATMRIARLWRSLNARKYKGKPVFEFNRAERGKLRHIKALAFEDRIVHKCLCDNYLVKELSRHLIYDNSATLKGKGPEFSIKRTICHLQRFYRKYGNAGYVLRIDIHNYFASIDHKILFAKFRKVIEDDEVYNFVCSLIPDEVGLGLGSQISQIAAVFFLNDLDHFIKERLHIKLYGRYMDDMYLISHSREELESALTAIASKLRELNLELNPEKTKITKLSEGFVFCKAKYLLWENGKILRLVTSTTFKSMHRKIRKGVDLAPVIPSWRDHLKHFDAIHRTRKFEKKEKIKIW